MKEKFKYRNKNFTKTLIIVTFVSCFILPFLLFLIELIDNVAAGFIVVGLIFVGMCAVVYLYDRVPSKFTADKDFVKFRLLFKKINIRCSDIKSIEVTHEYAKPQIRGDVGGYKELIKFVCRDGEYRFENIMKIDLEQTAANPKSLSEQFEYGIFMRLKNYISRQTGITY